MNLINIQFFDCLNALCESHKERKLNGSRLITLDGEFLNEANAARYILADEDALKLIIYQPAQTINSLIIEILEALKLPGYAIYPENLQFKDAYHILKEFFRAKAAARWKPKVFIVLVGIEESTSSGAKKLGKLVKLIKSKVPIIIFAHGNSHWVQQKVTQQLREEYKPFFDSMDLILSRELIHSTNRKWSSTNINAFNCHDKGKLLTIRMKQRHIALIYAFRLAQPSRDTWTFDNTLEMILNSFARKQGVKHPQFLSKEEIEYLDIKPRASKSYP